MYDHSDEATRAEALTVEPLLARLVPAMVRHGSGDCLENRATRRRQFRMGVENVAPAFEREHDPTAVRIRRLPHPGIVAGVGGVDNSLFGTCP